MKRTIIAEDKYDITGIYIPDTTEQEPQCTWCWNKETGVISDVTGITSIVVGYAKNKSELLSTTEANAFLIAAAPDMYEACREFMLVHRSFNGMLANKCTDEEIVGAMDGLLDIVGAMMDKALAKAEGMEEK